MGTRGPAPKRSDQRRRTNSPDAEQVEIAAEVVAQPPAPKGWHALAVGWYESLAASGQARFYEPSDWAMALIIGESISRELKPQPIVVTDELGAKKVDMVRLPPKAGTIAAWLKAMTDLMATEGARRRAQLELTRPPAPGQTQEGASNVVSWADRARQRAGA